MVPEPRRSTADLPADALGAAARRPQLLTVHPDPGADAVGWEPRRPARPPQAAVRLPEPCCRPRRRTRRAGVGRSRDNLGRYRRHPLPRRRQRLLGAGAAGADRLARAQGRGSDGRGVELDDLQTWPARSGRRVQRCRCTTSGYRPPSLSTRPRTGSLSRRSLSSGRAGRYGRPARSRACGTASASCGSGRSWPRSC